MKAILIDPETRTVSEIQIEDPDKAKPIAQALKCETITSVIRFGNEDLMFGDDEALLTEPTAGFMFVAKEDKSTWILAGRALILGGKGNGETTNVKQTTEDVEAQIFAWMTAPGIKDYAEAVMAQPPKIVTL